MNVEGEASLHPGHGERTGQILFDLRRVVDAVAGTLAVTAAVDNGGTPAVLYHNNHDGTFTDVTARSGVGIPGYAMGCAVADYDNDGHEDIFITNYGAHRLLHNNGDGTFTDVSVDSGLAAHAGTGMGVIASDYDGDGDTDVFVANDERANSLFQNDGHGRFQEVATDGIWQALLRVPDRFRRPVDNAQEGKLKFPPSASDNALHPRSRTPRWRWP